MMPEDAKGLSTNPGDGLRSVLLVDTEVVVRAPLADFLRDCGLTVIEVSDTGEAKSALLEGRMTIDVVLCDTVTVGTQECFQFSRWMKSQMPDIPVLLAGSLDRAASIAGDLCDEGPSVSRPYDPSLVLDAMRRAMSSRHVPEA